MPTELDSFLRRTLTREGFRNHQEFRLHLTTGTPVRLYLAIHPNAERAVLIAEVVQPLPYHKRYAAELEKLQAALDALPVIRDDKGNEVARAELLLRSDPYYWLTPDETSELRGMIEQTVAVTEKPWAHHDGCSFAVRPATLWNEAPQKE